VPLMGIARSWPLCSDTSWRQLALMLPRGPWWASVCGPSGLGRNGWSLRLSSRDPQSSRPVLLSLLGHGRDRGSGTTAGPPAGRPEGRNHEVAPGEQAVRTGAGLSCSQDPLPDGALPAMPGRTCWSSTTPTPPEAGVAAVRPPRPQAAAEPPPVNHAPHHHGRAGPPTPGPAAAAALRAACRAPSCLRS